MRMLPNADQAIIDPVKLHGYLLSTSHPIGRFKAAFFASLGYTATNWGALDRALREQHLTQPARLVETTRYGRKFEIRYSEGTERAIGHRPERVDDPDRRQRPAIRDG